MKRFWFKLGLLGLAFTAMAIVVPDAWAQSPAAEGLGEFARQAGFGGTADIRLIIGRLIRSMLVLVHQQWDSCSSRNTRASIQ